MSESEIGWLDLEDASNVRDLGGLPAATGRTRHGVLLRSDALDALTSADVAVLASRGRGPRRRPPHRRRAGGAGGRPAPADRPPTASWRPSTTRSSPGRQARDAAFAAGVDPITIMAEGYGGLLESRPMLRRCSAASSNRPACRARPLLGRQGSHGRAGRAAARAAGVEREAVVTDYAGPSSEAGVVARRAAPTPTQLAREIPASCWRPIPRRWRSCWPASTSAGAAPRPTSRPMAPRPPRSTDWRELLVDR